MWHKLWIGVGALVLAVALAACQVQAPPQAAPASGGGEETTTAGSGDGPATYVLGVVQPFTGPLGSFGTDFRKGIELAVEQMNAQLSAANVGVQFSTVSADTEGTPDGAAKAVQTVVQTSGAQVVVGPLTTSEVLGAKQFADENQIVIVAPASSGLAAAIPDDYIFRVMHPLDNFAGQAFQEIASQRGYENIVILQVDDPFGNGMTDIFQNRFQEAGGGEVSVVKYAPDPPDLSSEVSKVTSEVDRLSQAGKTAFFCVCFLGDGQKVLQQAVVNPTLKSVDWMGVENLRNPEILQDPAHAQFLADVNFTTVSFAETQTPNTQPFIDAFVAKFDSEPGPFTNYAYDAANVAMLSMLVAGNHGAAVKQILPYIADHYIGTQVQTYLDENGDQAIAYLGVYRVSDDGTDFTQIGFYDGATGKLTLEQ